MFNYLKKIFFYLFLSLVPIPILAIEAQAYLDPGTGSQLFQLLLASLFGVLYSIKLYWKGFAEFFKNIFIKTNKKKDD